MVIPWHYAAWTAVHWEFACLVEAKYLSSIEAVCCSIVSEVTQYLGCLLQYWSFILKYWSCVLHNCVAMIWLCGESQDAGNTSVVVGCVAILWCVEAVCCSLAVCCGKGWCCVLGPDKVQLWPWLGSGSRLQTVQLQRSSSQVARTTHQPSRYTTQYLVILAKIFA